MESHGLALFSHCHRSVLSVSYRMISQKRPGSRRGPIRAVHTRQLGPGLMIHTDRGTRFCCHGYRKAVQENEIIHSTSRQGNCWDNAVAESFFRTLKTEWAYHIYLKDYAHAKEELFEYIEAFYNCQRLHQRLNYSSPAAFEKQKN